MEGAVGGLSVGPLDDGAVVVVGGGLARVGEEGLVDLGVEAPGGSLFGEGLAGGELEADEVAVVGEELGHALGPLGAEVGGEGAEELHPWSDHAV